jgi:hypothetical protein
VGRQSVHDVHDVHDVRDVRVRAASRIASARLTGRPASVDLKFFLPRRSGRPLRHATQQTPLFKLPPKCPWLLKIAPEFGRREAFFLLLHSPSVGQSSSSEQRPSGAKSTCTTQHPSIHAPIHAPRRCRQLLRCVLTAVIPNRNGLQKSNVAE